MIFLLKKMYPEGIADDVRDVLSFMKQSGVRLIFFTQSLIFSFGLTIFSLYTVSLLFPLVNGIISGDWTTVKSMPLVGLVIGRYSTFFSTNIRLFLLLVVWIYVTILLKNVLQYCAFLTTTRQAKRAVGRLRDLLVEKCLSFGKGFYDQTKISAVHDILTRSTLAVENQFRALQSFIIDMLLLVMYLLIMFFISWKLTLLALVIFPVTSALTRSVIQKIRSLIKSADNAYATVSERVLSILNAMPLIKGFGTEQAEQALFRETSEREISESFRIQKLQNLVGPIEDIGATTATLILGCGMALMLYLDHTLTASNAFIFFYLATKMNASLAGVNTFRMGLASSSAAVGKITALLQQNDHFIPVQGKRQFTGLSKGIEIRDLSFSYPGRLNSGINFSDPDRAVLKGVSFTIEKGKTTAIVGPTGSGKSTIANLLLGFYNAPAGSILLDGIDMREYDMASVRKKTSFVSQDVLLLNTTIGHNMRYASHGDVSDSQLASISMQAAVHEFVARLPAGYETPVGDRGSTLSGGEKQRIALARAMLRTADIFIVDEATSSLDPLTEQAVNKAIADYGKDKAVLIISHRLSAIRTADTIICLEDGKIVEQGSHGQLLSQQGAFYRQWQTQKA